jgi:carboxypeptidase family protein
VPRLLHSAAPVAVVLFFVGLLLVPPATAQPAPSAAVPGPALGHGHSSPSPIHLQAAHPAPAVAHPPRFAAPLPQFAWGIAYIIYGPNDDASLFMGEGAAMVVDDNLRNITTFGGLGTGGLSNWTVNYNYSVGYFNVTVPNPTPSARTNVSFASVPGRDFAVLFGGLTNLAHQRTAADTWVYYFANQSWQNVTHAVAPPARQSAAFAVNGSGNTALLEGGWNPSYTSNGSTAAVIWNDTWSLNLTTFAWTELHPTSAPPPLYGSGLIWQNATNRYDLFGGCGLLCSQQLWSFGGTPATWTVEAETNVPSARASAAFVWDGSGQVGILQGGFSWGAGGATPLGDGFLFSPKSGMWSSLQAGLGPGPRYDAPNSWADFPGCVGLNFLGGDISLSGPPRNVSLLAPIGAPLLDCFPNLVGGGSPPPPPCSVASTPLEVRVVDAANGSGIGGARVSVLGNCLAQTLLTNSDGYLNVSLPAPDFINLSASATGYHDNSLGRRFLPNTTNFVVLPLTADPTLSVRAWVRGVTGIPEPLANVSVQQGHFQVLGKTGSTGYLNISRLPAAPGLLDLEGSLTNYSDASTTVDVPVTGLFRANLTLDAPGSLDIHIVDAATGLGLAAVNEEMRDLDNQGPSSVPFSVDANGWYNISALPAANYSISAGADGYASNQTTFDHVWIQPQTIVLPLSLEVGAVLGAFVRNASSGVPIGGATVRLIVFATIVTTNSGWANFTDIRPPGLYQVLASAPGYSSNYSVVQLSYGQRAVPYYINLKPLVGCPNVPGCPAVAQPKTPPPFGYLNAGGGVGTLLLATPVALLGAGLLYTATLAWRSTRRASTRAALAGTGR